MKLHVKGLYVFCMKCKVLVGNKKAKCRDKNLLAKNCTHKDKHKYQSRIWDPERKTIGFVRTWNEKDFSKVVKLHNAYKEDCKQKTVKEQVRESRPSRLKECVLMFLDFLQDIGVPEQNKRNISEERIMAYRRYLKRFLELAGNVPINSISEHEVGEFHKWVLGQGFGPRSYNDHMEIMKSFFSFLIKKDYQIKNPFENVKLKYVPKKREILTGEELEKLFSVMTEENKHEIYRGKKVKRLHPWLKDSIMLALLIGERRDGVFLLKWEHVEDNYIKVPNWKVNKAHDVEEYHYVPITLDLAELLLKLSGTGEGYIIAPERKNRVSLKQSATMSFTHFWRLTGSKKKVTFKNLRKTYVTRIRMLLGDKAKGLGIHKTDEVQINHYINQQEITKELTGMRLFDTEPK